MSEIEILNLTNNFFQVTNEVFERDLPPHEIAVYCYLNRISNNTKKSCYPSLTKIAEKTGMSKRKVQECIDELVKQQFVHKIRRVDNSNIYYLLPVASDTERIIKEISSAQDATMAQDAIPIAPHATPMAQDATPPWHTMPPINTNITKTKCNTNNNNTIFQKWLSYDSLIKHKYCSEKQFKSINKIVKERSESEVIKAIQNYAEVLSNPQIYYFSHKYTIDDFISRGIYKFFDECDPLINFIKKQATDKKSALLTEAQRIYKKYEVKQ